MDTAERIKLITRNVEEVIGADELPALAGTGQASAPLHRPGDLRRTAPRHGPGMYAKGARSATGGDRMHDISGGLAHLDQREARRGIGTRSSGLPSAI